MYLSIIAMILVTHYKPQNMFNLETIRKFELSLFSPPIY